MSARIKFKSFYADLNQAEIDRFKARIARLFFEGHDVSMVVSSLGTTDYHFRDFVNLHMPVFRGQFRRPERLKTLAQSWLVDNRPSGAGCRYYVGAMDSVCGQPVHGVSSYCAKHLKKTAPVNRMRALLATSERIF